MTPKEIAKTAVSALEDKKGADIKVLDTLALTTLADYFVLCTATSTTQLKALSGAVEEKLKNSGETPHHIEGHRGNTWVLMDYSSVVVHLFLEETRAFYNLEKLWGDAPEIELT
ncbi:MAG TPA: ribosome silencing factor [Oscillospiraceae bacterium]|nr:ribosome silencing factor [Oscillospiraceae bacterium]